MTAETVSRPAARGALFYLGFYGTLAVYLPFLNVYFQHLGLSGWDIGLLTALFPAMILILTTPLSMVADRRSWRVRMLVVATVGVAVTLLLLVFPRSFAALVPLMLLLAIFRSPLTPLADSLIVAMAARHDLNYGGMRLWGSLSFALASVAAGALWQHLGYQPMFVVAGLLYLPVAVLGLALPETAVVERRADVSLRPLARDSVLLILVVTTFLVAAGTGMDMTFAGIYMTHLGGSDLLVGMLFGVAALSELPTMRWSGVLAQRLGGQGMLLLSYGLFGVAYLGYALSPVPFVLLAFSVLRGMAYGLFYVSTVRLLNERTPPQWSTTLQGVMNAAAFGLAQLIAGPISGHVYDVAGPVAVYAVAALVVGCAVLLMGAVVVLQRLRPARRVRVERQPAGVRTYGESGES